MDSFTLHRSVVSAARTPRKPLRLTPWNRLLLGNGAFWVATNRFPKIAIGIRPSILLCFHRALIQQKYRLLFTPESISYQGPKRPRRNSRRDPRNEAPHLASLAIALAG
jgi:hypothetical protein